MALNEPIRQQFQKGHMATLKEDASLQIQMLRRHFQAAAALWGCQIQTDLKAKPNQKI